MSKQECQHLTLTYSREDDDGFNDYDLPYKCKDCPAIFWVDKEPINE